MRSNITESSNEFLKPLSPPLTALKRMLNSGNKVKKTVSFLNGILLTPEKCLTLIEVPGSPQTDSSNPAEKLMSQKEGTGSNLSLSSLKQVTSPEMSTFLNFYIITSLA